jgi:malate/lactate dehydrogenase
MLTKILSRAKLKQPFLELFVNKTDKATDVSDNSVTNAVAYGVATVAQKCIKDIAIVESQIMPDSAVGTGLDNAATLFGVPARLGALQSSTSVKIIADSGTFYVKTTMNSKKIKSFSTTIEK